LPRDLSPTISVMAKKKAGPHKLKRSEPDPPEWNGNIVKELRIDGNLTVAELAERSGLSTGQVSDIENGTGGFSPESLYRLARALGVSRRALLPKDPWDRTRDDIWPFWEAANSSQRSQLTSIAKTIVVPDKPKR
jgi:transcriptional regulator with XRE-family HTH domain